MTDTPARFEDLIERHHHELYAYLWRLLDGAGRVEAAMEAEDLLQDVFERAYRAYPRLRPVSNVRAWLYKIATNTAFSVLRRGGRFRPLGDEDAERLADDPHRGPHHQAELGEEVEALHAAILDLPPAQHAAVVMRHLHGLEYAEIAAALECSEESARANVSHGIRRLRCVLAPE
jgi:RNA polymerase sigma-70 factor (ECF subfamily)